VLAVTVLLGILLVAVGCAPAAPAPTATPPPITKLKFHSTNYLSSLPYFIAIKEGYFAEQGIEVEHSTAPPQQEFLPLLIDGQLDAMSKSFNSAMINAFANSDIKYVMSGSPWTFEGCVAGGLLARKELIESGALDDPANATKYRFALRAHSFPAFMTERFLSSAGLTAADLDMTPLKTPLMGEALAQGAIDVIWCGEPWTTRILNEGNAAVWKGDAEIAPGYTTGGIVLGSRLLADRDLSQRFVTAVAKGFLQLVEGKTDRNLELAAEFTGLDRELLEQVCWPTVWTGQPNVEPWMDYQDWALREGLIDAAIDPEEHFDLSFLEQAMQELGETQ
jgi:NitT/TauT family transport system substrate-binding protein